MSRESLGAQPANPRSSLWREAKRAMQQMERAPSETKRPDRSQGEGPSVQCSADVSTSVWSGADVLIWRGVAVTAGGAEIRDVLPKHFFTLFWRA